MMGEHDKLGVEYLYAKKVNGEDRVINMKAVKNASVMFFHLDICDIASSSP